MTPMKAIREKCLDCCCGSAHEVKLCTCTDCPLYPFRLGRNPNAKRECTPAQLEALKNHRYSKKSRNNISDSEHDGISEGNYTPEQGEDENAAEN